jgi:hypothetical protein
VYDRDDEFHQMGVHSAGVGGFLLCLPMKQEVMTTGNTPREGSQRHLDDAV